MPRRPEFTASSVEKNDSSSQQKSDGDSLFIGTSEQANQIRRLIRMTARSTATALVVGDSGVGKEVVAREIHRLSDRNPEPFVPINCAAIPEGLIESELFGHSAGAFTDAKRSHLGAFERAGKGTLLLDEIGELELTAQPKLLRAIECGEIDRVGGEKPVPVRSRIIASTNQDLKSLCRRRLFRPDLYYRLCVIEIRVPPLRERIEDVVALTDHFLKDRIKGPGGRRWEISDCGIAALRGHDWPGNGRELLHVLERAAAFHSGPVLTAEAFNMQHSDAVTSLSSLLALDWRSAKRQLAETYARNLLRKHDGCVRVAAKEAGLSPGGFYKWLRKMGIDT